MAIKGRSKPRSRKVVTPGPRPAYVPVKKPLLARRGVRIAILAVVAVGAAAGIWYGIAKERSEERARELQQRKRTAAVTFQGKIEAAIVGVGQPAPPSGFSAFPALTADVEGLSNGDVKPEAAAEAAKGVRTTARGAWQALDEIDLTEMVAGKGFDLSLVNYFFNAREKMADALKLYERVAVMVEQAANASGAERADVLDSAKGITDVAASLFNSGYSDYVQVQFEGGILQPSFGTAPAG
ncbi:MAG TPA: hypothetical protein VGA93_08020 [Actinomycetota bacterium]